MRCAGGGVRLLGGLALCPGGKRKSDKGRNNQTEEVGGEG